MRKTNIHKRSCNICGHVEDKENDLELLHEFTGIPGYGSMYDGDKITLYLCSDCLDSIVHLDRPEESVTNKNYYWE